MSLSDTPSWRAQHSARELIWATLLGAQIAPVGTETALHLADGEEYLDLEALSRGVQRANEGLATAGRVLPRSGVPESIWSTILTHLTRSRLPAAPVRL